MASYRRVKMDLVLIVTLIFASINGGTSQKRFPDKNIVSDWAISITKSVTQKMEQISGYSPLEKNYKNITIQHFVAEFEELDIDKIVEKLASDLSSMLSRKMDALTKSVIKAEQAASAHQWIPNIKREDVPYQDAKTLEENDTRLVYNERFKQHIIPNISSVHIPVEIFSGDVEILNGLKWSAALDEIFEENYDNDPEILWQYFGSQTGFMRTLPASIWKIGPGSVDLYDVRRRPWYTQGASSPKDMFILIDKSGSVHGQTLQLIQVSVKSLLDTLGENDFVNMAMFGEKTEFVASCFNGSFVQANYRNKQILMQEVEKIEAGGMADFKKGLTFAFEQFEKLKEESVERQGANCNRMIMLLTDGGSELAEEVFQKYNPKGNKTYRVFTYAVGPTANPVSAIRWMACVNRGYFSQIPAMGAIRSKVQEYVDVISRPLALKQEEYGLWTSIYPGLSGSREYMKKPAEALETFNLGRQEFVQYSVKTDPRGLGMMTTVTLPVYSKATGSAFQTNQTILGVMGIDVTTDQMLKYAPLRKFGPNGYPFAINANGYIVFHPKLKLLGMMMKDPPNIDFLDVEVENEATDQLRKDMIDGKTDKVEIEMYTVSNDLRHVDVEKGERKRKFSYRNIVGTTFSVGLSLPAYHQYHLKLSTSVKKFMENEAKLLSAGETALLIADWDYYKNFTGNTNRNGTIMDLLEALENPDNYEWDQELISHLLWDLKMTSMMNDYWQVIMNEDKAKNIASNGTVDTNSTNSLNETLNSNNDTTSTDNGSLFKGVFVGTNGGLTRIYPKSCMYKDLASHGTARNTPYQRQMYAIKCSDDVPQSGITFESFLDKRNTWVANYFKRAVDMDPHWVFSAPYILDPTPSDNSSVGDVMAVRAVPIDYDMRGVRVDYRAAVVGLVFKDDSLRQTMVNFTRNTHGLYDCSDSESMACYLLDDGAFVISTNQISQNTSVGRFFGRVDPELMNDLYNRSIFKRTEQFDYQATCIGPPKSETDGQTSAGSLAFRIPSINVLFEFITLNWWTNIVSWAFTNFNLYNMITPTPQTQVYAAKQDEPRVCIKKQAQYYLDDNLSVLEGQVDCEVRNLNCSRKFVSVPIKDTNLLFVIVETAKTDCEVCSTRVKQLLQEPREEDPQFCDLKPRYRKPTETCYDYDPREDDTQCGASLTHPVSYFFISCVAIVTILFSQR